MTSSPSSALSRSLGIDWPLIQAPLGGGPSTPELVAAACEAGALGSLGAAYMAPGQLEEALAAIRRLTARPFGVNLFAPAPVPRLAGVQIAVARAATRAFRDELGLSDPDLRPPYHEDFAAQLSVVLRAKPAVFSFTFGLIGAEAVAACKSAGICVMGTATTLDEGLALQKLGVDAVVAQGLEAGGHRGQFDVENAEPGRAPADEGTLALTRRLVAALALPVAASGGLMDGRDIAAALAAGAQAAHLGTAFLLCDEAGTSKPYRAALAAAKSDTTRFTKAFSGRWARGLDNRFMRELDGRGNAVLPFPAQNAFTRDIRKAAAVLGRAEFLSLWAGRGVVRIRALPAGKLVELLREETAAALDAA